MIQPLRLLVSSSLKWRRNDYCKGLWKSEKTSKKKPRYKQAHSKRQEGFVPGMLSSAGFYYHKALEPCIPR